MTKFFFSWMLSLFIVFGASAQSKKKTKQEPPKPQPPKSAIAEKTKATQKIPGLFTLFKDTTSGQLYLMISNEQLNQSYIYFGYTENGVTAAGHFRGSFRDNAVFKIRRHYDRIEFVKENTGFYFDSTNAVSKAADANISKAILVSQKILGEENGNMLIDASAIFLTEAISQIKPLVMPSPMGMSFALLGNLNKDKSKFVKLRNYAENTDLIVEYVYDNPNPINSGGKEVTDARAVSIVYQHTFIKAPEKPMQPRRDDQRVGYFAQQINDMTTTHAVAYKDVINRWRLEKKDPNAAISEPIKPIVWWIENTTPQEFRPIIKEAGLKWNLAFEKAGFKNAIQLLEQPDTATWDAGDIAYNVLRWTSSPQPPFGGYGPSFVDPRTGEILGADIMLEYIFVTNRISQEKLYNVQPSSIEYPTQLHQHNHMHMCDAAHHLHYTSLFGSMVADAHGLSNLEKREYLHQSLYYLVLHEMGHTLGLMHNMRASQLWSPTEAHNKVKTQKIGLTGSVMDYPAVNVASDKTKQGEYFTTTPGPYDMWAIEYGYSTSLDDETEEEKRLQAILIKSTDPMLAFGNDADDMRAPGKGIDPRVNINDFSSDAIAYGIERILLANTVIVDLTKRYRTDGKSNQELKQAYSISLSEITNAANAISRYVGGVYVDRNMLVDRPAYTPVHLSDQKRAMGALSQHIFGVNSFKASEDLFRNLQNQRRGFNFFGSPDDPKIHDRILFIQSQVLAHLLAPSTMKRITDSRMYGNKYGLIEMTTDLTQAIFKDDINSPISTMRQNLQIEYVNMLTKILENKSNMYDHMSRSAAFNQLKQIKQMTSTPGLTAETKAHREHLQWVVDQIMSKK
jgi:hypothetical protein